MAKKLFLKNRATFTADTDDIDLSPDVPISHLNIAVDYLQNGVTAPTLATILEYINDVYVKDGGAAFSEIDFTELYALQILAFGLKPWHLLPAGDNQYGNGPLAVVPVNLPAAKKGQNQVKLTYTGVTTVDTGVLTITAEQGPLKGALAGKITGRLAIKQTSKTPAATGWTEESRVPMASKGRLLGLLCYLTTIPTASVAVTSASMLEAKITRGGTDYKYYNIVEQMADKGRVSDDSAVLAILDNYFYIDLSDEPLDLAAEVIRLEWNAGTADAVRVVSVIDEPIPT